MKCESVGVSFSSNYKLSEKTLENISKKTKLSKDELMKLPLDEGLDLMRNCGAIKRPNPIRTFFIKAYTKFGEKLGLLEKRSNINTDID